VYLTNAPGVGSSYAFDLVVADAGTGGNTVSTTNVAVVSDTATSATGLATGINVTAGDVMLIGVRGITTPNTTPAVWALRCAN
jgi:hypothetical protein